MPDDTPSVESILAAAIEIPDPCERDDFVVRECGGDASWLAQIRQLIDFHFRAGSFLDHPVMDVECGPADAPSLEPLEQPGSWVGPYLLREAIGEGGMGIVYVAEQEVPVRRRVALKIIKPGMDTREVVSRFEAEKQVLALMDHAGIAKVFDAGVTATGRPYFVMELVKGVPITEYCDQESVSIRDRLNLFIDVCHAIQHAHQKGIIHRDIKPSNILVTLSDGVPVPKVIDFGIAKATDQRLTDNTVYTSHQQMMGTPLYMSPEQADISSVDVDTRSDVYSLGVLLYELLTGWTPFDRDQMQASDWGEVRRVLRETEPPRPSARVTTRRHTCTTKCPRCRGEPRSLVQVLRGELDWIVMRALDKDRARRYQTARGLAADVRRYLNGEPVEACPPSWIYQIKKFTLRHKLAMAAGTLILLTLCLATGVSLWLARQAYLAHEHAERLLQGERAVSEELARRDAELRQELYATDVSLAWRFWLDGDSRRVVDLLERWTPATDEDDIRGVEWHQLWSSVCDRPLLFSAHRSPILSADVSPDDQRVVSSDRSGHIKIWSLADGRELQSLRYGGEEVGCVRFSPDGNWLATAGQDRTIRLWRVADWSEVARLEGHERTVVEIDWSPDGTRLASAARDNTVRVWDTISHQAIRVLTESTDVVRSVDWSPDGKRLAAAGGDRIVRVWNTDSWQLEAALEGHDRGLLAVEFSPDGRWLASAGYSSAVLVHDCHALKQWAYVAGSGTIWSITFSRDSRTLVVGGNEGRVGLWQIPAHEGDLIPLRITQSLRGASRSGTFAQRDQLMLTASEEDHVIRVDSMRNVTGCQTFRLEEDCLAVDLERNLAATVSAAGDLTLRGLDDGIAQRCLSPGDGRVLAAAISSDGELVARSTASAALGVYRSKTGELLHQLSGLTSRHQFLVFSPDGAWLVGGGDDGTVRVWAVATGRLIHELPVPYREGPVQPAFSADSQFLAAGSLGGIAIWELPTGRQTATLESTRPSTYGVAFSPDGKWLAAGGDGHVSLWDLELRREYPMLTGNPRKVVEVAFAPDSRSVATIAMDGTARFWHVMTRRELFTFVRGERDLSWIRFVNSTTLAVGVELNDKNNAEVLLFGGSHRALAVPGFSQ